MRNCNSDSQLEQKEPAKSADSSANKEKTGSDGGKEKTSTKTSISNKFASSLGAIQKTRNIFKSSNAQANQPEKEKSKVQLLSGF